jgi:hypothetical protein
MRPGSRPPDSPRAFPPRPPVAGRRRRGRGRRLGLGICLIRLLPGVTVSARAELIGGSYTNVIWDIGACIAADGALHLVSQGCKRRKMERNRCGPARETYRLLHHVCSDAAREPGHIGQDHPACHPAPVSGGQDRPGPGTEPALVSGP